MFFQQKSMSMMTTSRYSKLKRFSLVGANASTIMAIIRVIAVIWSKNAIKEAVKKVWFTMVIAHVTSPSTVITLVFPDHDLCKISTPLQSKCSQNQNLAKVRTLTKIRKRTVTFYSKENGPTLAYSGCASVLKGWRWVTAGNTPGREGTMNHRRFGHAYYSMCVSATSTYQWYCVCTSPVHLTVASLTTQKHFHPVFLFLYYIPLKMFLSF